MLRLSPRDVDQLTPAELAAMMLGFLKSRGVETVSAPSDEDFYRALGEELAK
ncbi:hypothetical protein M2322_000849 [Rhodoblastus acidophilus]|uniref:hypothetical protein n=1 Tax=Rhodoblastus acidophilus TaxID=1074 RepID=UPI002224BBF4|nr:hypothetical protein [Rhodoblastus acidophilus]MCW2315315.1 hypothetical protein [Rhodoblastus acidophilus]